MKNNLMVRMITLVITLSILIAHFVGQVDLLHPTWLWVSLFAALMGLQATFTGWCPSNLVGKLSKSGECCPAGSCSTAKNEVVKTETASACCSGQNETKQEGCCSDTSKTESGCCSETSSKAEGCCSHSQSDKVEGEVIEFKILGTGCANCDNTAKSIESVAKEKGIAVKITKIEDVAKIVEYGVMSTPAVVVGEEVVHSGSVPSKEKILAWLS